MRLHDDSQLPITRSDDSDDALSTDVPRVLQTRNVTWVVKWAAAVATFASSAAVLAEFGYCLMAEQTLARAARAAAVEATLPRADYRSVEQTAWRRLASFECSRTDISLRLEQNAKPVRGKFAPKDGDRFSITLSAATEAVLPKWVRAVTFRKPGSHIVVHADARMPGTALQ